MTTWTIKACKANPPDQNSGAPFTTPADTGFRYDDSVTLTNWTPDSGSTADMPIRKLLSTLQSAMGFAEGKPGGEWTLVADNGSGTVYWPNRDPL